MDSRFYGAGSFIDEIRTRLESLTLDQVNAAIGRHLQADNLAVAVVTRDAEAFRDELLSGAPSTVIYNTAVDEAILAEDAEIRSYPLAINRDRVRVVPVGDVRGGVVSGSAAQKVGVKSKRISVMRSARAWAVVLVAGGHPPGPPR